MRAVLLDKNGSPWEAPLLCSWDIRHTSGETCDSFEITLPFEAGMLPRLRETVTFRGVNNGETVFVGLVDEYVLLCDERGSTVTVSGRGMASRLMDNEAESCVYASVSLDGIVTDHVLPWGITDIEKSEMPRLYTFTVSSGESEWSVLTRYCRYSAGIQPRFSREGALILNDKAGSIVKIGEGSPVTSIKRRDCRYGLISSVLVKNKVTGAQYTVHNENFEVRGGQSRRVLLVPRTATADAMRYQGGYQIDRSKKDKDTIEIEIMKQFAAFPGDVAEVTLPAVGITGSYRVTASRCYADENSAGTVLTLEVT